MKNILFVAASLGFGGAGKMLLFVASELSKRGYSVGVANLRSNGAPAYERPVPEEIKYRVIETSGRRGLRRIEQINGIRRMAKEMDADILVGFNFFPNYMVSIVGKQLRIPSVMAERGNPESTAGNDVVYRLLRALVESCDGGVFQTEGAKAQYGKRLQARGTVIPNPIFVSGDEPRVSYSERARTVVSFGRFDNHQKRYDVMIDAFSLFAETHPEYTLRIYGSGPDEAKIREWASASAASERILFMGVTTQPMKDIAADGAFIITSDFEGISNALLEAMAMGLPCVSTDHAPGGARLLITHGENGLLAPVGDKEALAKALSELADNPELAEKCGENARLVTERFHPDLIIDAWEEYLVGLADKK